MCLSTIYQVEDKFARGFNDMKKLTLILLLFITSTSLAQNRQYRLRADKAYTQKDYITAAYYYDKALENGTTTTQGTVPYFSTRQNKHHKTAELAYITYRLAESYRLYQNTGLAEKWYGETVNKYDALYPVARLWYAVCLRSANHFDEAITQLQAFISGNKAGAQYIDQANKELNNCRFAKEQMGTPTLSKTVKMGGNLNKDAGDFALSVNNDKYWFTSSRTAADNKDHLNGIFTGSRDSSSAKTRLDWGPVTKDNLQYGTPSLEASGKRMYFTIWYMDGTNKIAAVYLSKFINNKWLTPQKLNNYVNTKGYNAMQPFVTPDGKRLYFASNKPGGIGGTDIWMSDLDIEGTPLNSANLGSTINSPDDEQAPFFDVNSHKLIYSSKGFVGMGSFDLYESLDTNKHWTAPKNLGYPFNSTKDDLYYYPDSKDSTTFYISSDRESECCLNLFKVKLSKPKPKPVPKPVVEQTAVLTGIVIDCATSKPLAGVDVNLVDALSQATVNLITDVTGKYQFQLTIKHSYALKLEKPDYFTKIVQLPSVTASKTDTLYNPVICQQQYEIDKPVVINNILYDFKKYTLKPESKVVLDDLITILKDNPDIKVELSSHTDSYGPDWSNRLLSQHRAQSCVNYIISRGISRRRIIAKGYGATMPIAPNKLPDGRDNPAGRRLNRRTEFKVLSDE
jgi:OOP family OmpA-OmpF porin